MFSGRRISNHPAAQHVQMVGSGRTVGQTDRTMQGLDQSHKNRHRARSEQSRNGRVRVMQGDDKEGHGAGRGQSNGDGWEKVQQDRTGKTGPRLNQCQSLCRTGSGPAQDPATVKVDRPRARTGSLHILA